MAQQSRPVRWSEASNQALVALEAMSQQLGYLEGALGDLRGIQEEYEENRDNMPENLTNSPYGEKLNAVCDLQIEDIAEAVRNAIEEAQDRVGEANEIDLPRGFGKD
jgi:hypothetical protein